MADIIVTVGVEQKKRINLELQARKSLDGNILIFDHKEIDIVIMPLKRKIVTFAKSEINDSVYEVQNRFFNFLKRKGLFDFVNDIVIPEWKIEGVRLDTKNNYPLTICTPYIRCENTPHLLGQIKSIRSINETIECRR